MREFYVPEPLVDVYLFGSILSSKDQVSDIDILLIYRELDPLINVRAGLSRLGLQLPLHVLAMSAAEEDFFSFVSERGAVNLQDWQRDQELLKS